MVTDDVSVYPNPVTDSKLFITSSGNVFSASIYDAAGKLVKTFLLNGRSIHLNLEGISKGIYQIKIVTENSIQSKKIIIQ